MYKWALRVSRTKTAGLSPAVIAVSIPYDFNPPRLAISDDRCVGGESINDY